MLVLSQVSYSAFTNSDVPQSIKTLYCDGNPRILVEFTDAARNIWFKANIPEQSGAFLSTALTAKTTGKKMWYLGSNQDALTEYCISVSAREVYSFGIL